MELFNETEFPASPARRGHSGCREFSGSGRRPSPSPTRPPWTRRKSLRPTAPTKRRPKLEISWRKFDNGADVIAAIASGDVQIGYLGSSPLTAAIDPQVPGRNLPHRHADRRRRSTGRARRFRDQGPQDLIGKKIAVPFVSTGHYSLLAALKHWNIDPAKVTILNLAPPAIAAAWKRGDIDATYVWDPALGVAKETGKVLITSGELAKFGAPTFDAWIVRKDFADKHPEIVKAFAKTTLDAYADYRKDPKAWLADQRQRRQTGETVRRQTQR
jgi:taurine transport system substrate-binding protein